MFYVACSGSHSAGWHCVCFCWKQKRELNDEVLLMRQQALMSLCDYLHDPEHIAAAIDEGNVCNMFSGHVQK